MKKIFIYILCFLLSVPASLAVTHAVNCKPTFNRNYTVEGNCTWPGNYKVFGDITVGGYTVTVPTGVVLGIDLGSKKITFGTGKILMSGTAKIDNTVSTKYYESKAYTTSATTIKVTSCMGGGFEPLNAVNGSTPTNYVGGSVMSAPANGTMHCGK